MIGLAALGHATVSQLLLPQLQPYMARLQVCVGGDGGAEGRAGGQALNAALKTIK